MRFLAAAAVAALLTPALALAADFPLSEKNTTIGFVGTKPGGKHDGGFKSVTGAASVTGTDATNPKSNPKSKFVTSKVEKKGDDYKITGTLTMLGKDKEVSFPAKIAVTGDSLTVTSSFNIDRTQWGMTYGQGKVNNEVKLTVSVKAKG